MESLDGLRESGWFRLVQLKLLAGAVGASCRAVCGGPDTVGVSRVGTALLPYWHWHCSHTSAKAPRAAQLKQSGFFSCRASASGTGSRVSPDVQCIDWTAVAGAVVTGTDSDAHMAQVIG